MTNQELIENVFTSDHCLNILRTIINQSEASAKSPDIMTDIIISVIEMGMMKYFRLKVNKNTENNSEGVSFKSRNRILRIVRSLFKQKRRISNKVRKN